MSAAPLKVLVVDDEGRILYFNQAVTRYLGLQPNAEGQPITNFIPELEWERIARFDAAARNQPIAAAAGMFCLLDKQDMMIPHDHLTIDDCSTYIPGAGRINQVGKAVVARLQV